tara:strand:+ start:904 stop:1119 length:216 start_codon:yes stop_codon:yes gene_type:complete
MEIKMTKLHWDKWQEFRSNDSNTMTADEQELMARIHSVYFKHAYYIPCSCSPKTYNTWIDQINVIHDKGHS